MTPTLLAQRERCIVAMLFDGRRSRFSNVKRVTFVYVQFGCQEISGETFQSKELNMLLLREKDLIWDFAYNNHLMTQKANKITQ